LYLTNKDFVPEIVASKEQGKLTRKAEQMLYLLANKTIEKMRYTNEMDRDDCLQTGLLVMFSNWHNFDPNKSDNAFAYFTEVFKRGIAKGWGELRKQKGAPSDSPIKFVSIHSSNDGDGIYNI
jgi:DNA-directed RNA polymerase specialized sigma subunit